jgi:outer membrane receptor protein involved in Fe transport
LTAGIYQSLTPRLFNDLRVNWSKGEGNSFIRIDNFGGAVPPADSSLFPSFASSENSHFIFSISDNGALFRVGRNVDNFQRQVNLVDNLSIARGRHQVKVGVDYRRLSPTYGPLNYSQSVSFNFAGTKTGVARTVTIAANDTVGVLFTNLSAFIQDTWNLNSRLTVTYGLRWEHNPPPTGAGGKPLFTVQGLDNPLTMTLAPQGTPLWKTTYHDFAPRVGAAYQLFRRSGRETLLRGGLGVFYDLGNGQAANGSGFAFPNSRSVVLRSVPFPLDPSLVVAPPFTLSPPFNGTIYAFDPNLKLPLVYQWNVAIEQSLGRQQSVSASYVGAAGRRLLRQELLLNATSVNVINPIFSFVLASRNAATSDYDAFQLQYQRRLSRGLQVLGSYTWSHSIDSASSDSAQLAPISKIDPNTDRGPSDFDVRHSFTAAFSYDLPMPKLDRVSTALLRNWSVETIASARTALPVNIITGQDPLGTGLLSSQGVARPDLLLGVPLYIQDPNVPAGRRFNKAAFSVPTTARQGNLGRNALRGFPFSQVDFALRRQFNLTEHKNLQLRAELFNILNHPNFASPSGRLSSSVFGVSTNTLASSLGTGGVAGGLNPLYQVGGPRSIQFALKLQF